MFKQTKILLWRLFAILALLLGMVGVFLPIMPTVPFILVAAWAAGQGWPQLEQYLLTHAHFGKPIRSWRQRRAIPRRGKILASFMMTCSMLLLWLYPVEPWIPLSISAVMVCVLLWMWSRPDA